MTREKKVKRDKADIGPVLRAIGPLALTLKRAWLLLPLLMFSGAVVAVIGPLIWTDPGWARVRIAAGVLAALAIITDRVADTYEKKLDKITFKESERSAVKSIDHVNIFISEAIEAMFLRGHARTEAIKALQRSLVRCAAGCVGDGSRASYYPMRRGKGGTRVLDNPKHATEHGRYDKPNRPFVEAESPQLDVWTILDRDDEEPEVRIKGEDIPGIDWDKVKYETYYSVPVKANMVQFGFLSVNNAKVGAIGEPQRAAILAMARVFALVISGEKGQDFLNRQAAYHTVSAPTGTVSASTEGA